MKKPMTPAQAWKHFAWEEAQGGSWEVYATNYLCHALGIDDW
jgi:hypothetical protein